MFSYASPEARVQLDHPLRAIKGGADTAMKALNRDFDEFCGSTSRPSIPRERLLKSQLLIALYTIRSDWAFCEKPDYNLLFRWFLDMNLGVRPLDQSKCSRLRERIGETELARGFFEQVLRIACLHQLILSEHFTVDSTLIESWGSLKRIKRKDSPLPKDGAGGTGIVDFKGERKTNAIHESTTDPEAKLMRRGNRQPAKLSSDRHALMEPRSELCTYLAITVHGPQIHSSPKRC